MKHWFFSHLRLFVGLVGLFVALTASAQTVTLTPGTQGVAYSFQVTVPGTSYAATNLPPGVTINASTGLISGTPTAAATFTGVITVTGTVTNNYSYSLLISPPSGTPVVSTPTSINGVVGVAITPVSVVASNSPTSYNATGLAPGLTLNGTSGQISGTPTLAGSYTASLSANNGSGTGPVRLVNITIVAAPSAPVISSATVASGTPATPFTYTIVASNSPTSYGAAPLPLGLSLNSSTGVISGTPTLGGITDIALTATNGSGTSSVVTLRLTLGAPPVVSSLAASGTVGSGLSFTLQANPAASSFNVVGTLPAGLTFNGVNTISGTPTAAGSTNVSVSANSATGITGPTATLTITISSPSGGGGGGGGGEPVLLSPRVSGDGGGDGEAVRGRAAVGGGGADGGARRGAGGDRTAVELLQRGVRVDAVPVA